ncbi:MAG: RNA-binding cell elongation regulator Jag/EloR [Acidimicrobiales bacterium]
MDWVETTGKTLEEAKEAALDQLGVGVHDAEFEIVAEARNGLFGRVRSEARVRARVKPTHPRPKEDRRQPRRRSPAAKRNGSRSAPEGDEKPELAPVGATEANIGEDGDLAETEETQVKSPRRRTSAAGGQSRESPGKSDPRPSRAKKTGPPPSDPPANTSNGDEPMDEIVPIMDQGEVGREFLVGLTAQFGYSADVEIKELEEEAIELAISGQDLGLLIGSKGATLSALQDLTRTVVQRRTRARNGRIFLDVADYRKKRKAALEEFTRKVADDVLASGLEQTLEPMAPADRKVVHDTVNTIDGVSTRSEGEEPRRRVVLSPT